MEGNSSTAATYGVECPAVLLAGIIPPVCDRVVENIIAGQTWHLGYRTLDFPVRCI